MQRTIIYQTVVSALLILTVSGCRKGSSSANQISMDSTTYNQGSYGYDLHFLKEQGIAFVELTDSTTDARVLIAPCWQGRVLTSTASGAQGHSFGWINYQLIRSRKVADHFNAFGGEERLWLGPEGGPFSLYFKTGNTQEYANWKVPKELDTEAFELSRTGKDFISLTRSFKLENYSGHSLSVRIDREIRVPKPTENASFLGLELPQGVRLVGYRSINKLTNNGSTAWTRESGLPSIWMLSMLVCSPEVTVFIPFKEGNEKNMGPVLTDDYFGKVPADRLQVKDGLIWFSTDGKLRSKIGLSWLRAKNWLGSYDDVSKSLTLLWFSLPTEKSDYVNSKWGKQENSYSGDVVNSYNDGPLEDGSQMGPFYELETSSPAAMLKPGESLVHEQRIFHLEGDEAGLSAITKKIFGITINEIKTIF